MRKEYAINKLATLIEAHGYWSQEVYTFSSFLKPSDVNEIHERAKELVKNQNK